MKGDGINTVNIAGAAIKARTSVIHDFNKKKSLLGKNIKKKIIIRDEDICSSEVCGR